MGIWYKARPTFRDLITPVEVESFTEHFVKIKGKSGRTAIKTTYEAYFLTEQEARDFILKHYQSEIKKAEDSLDYIKRINEKYIQELENFKL